MIDGKQLRAKVFAHSKSLTVQIRIFAFSRYVTSFATKHKSETFGKIFGRFFFWVRQEYTEWAFWLIVITTHTSSLSEADSPIILSARYSIKYATEASHNSISNDRQHKLYKSYEPDCTTYFKFLKYVYEKFCIFTKI